MEFNLKSGTCLELKKTVELNDTALVYGSGLLEVFATPAMIAFMEKTCMELVGPELPEGYGTVGVSVEIKHVKASKVGSTICCTARHISTEGMKLGFEVEAKDEEGLIGKGLHHRYIINEQEFINSLS